MNPRKFENGRGLRPRKEYAERTSAPARYTGDSDYTGGYDENRRQRVDDLGIECFQREYPHLDGDAILGSRMNPYARAVAFRTRTVAGSRRAFSEKLSSDSTLKRTMELAENTLRVTDSSPVLGIGSILEEALVDLRIRPRLIGQGESSKSFPFPNRQVEKLRRAASTTAL